MSEPGTPPTPAAAPVYSVVIPVYNSEGIVGVTLERTVRFFEERGLPFEIVAVNDGSRDQSWRVLQDAARKDPRIIAVNLLRNYGQHHANMCGFTHAAGAWIVTLDDDMQNPPEEIRHLIDKGAEGHDLVIGRFKEKRHPLYRRLGTRLIRAVNRRIFGSPRDLVLTNFRLIRRDVVDRILGYRTSYPYVPGLALMFATAPANAWVEHREREVGRTNYGIYKILKLVATILFNYSSYPLRLVAGVGMAIAALSFGLGAWYVGLAFVRETDVPGWTTLVVLLSFFNGMVILILSMMGEYTVRMLNQISSAESFHVKEVVRGPG